MENQGERPKYNLDDYHTTLSETTAEIARLVQHPSLFPSSAVREAFGISLAKMYHKIKRIIDVREHMEDIAEEYLVNEAQAREKAFLPLRHQLRTHWQNFMHKDAPGVSHGPNYPFSWDPPGVGAVQMLPIPAANFITQRIKDSIDILNELDDVRFNDRVLRAYLMIPSTMV